MSNYLSGLSLRSLLLPLVLVGTLLTAACSGSPLSLLTGGGVNTAANTQIGKENTQTVGVSTQQRFATQNLEVTLRPVARPSTTTVETPQVQQVQNQTNNQLPAWAWITFIVLFVVGWVTDTPRTMLTRKT